MDPKVKNLIKFVITSFGGLVVVFFLFVRFAGVKDYVWLTGFITLLVAVWRIGLSVYRRLIMPAKKPLEFGKWAIVTGSTSGIGKEFADYLAKKGMSLLIVSRTESRLKEQAEQLTAAHGVAVKYLAYDFTELGAEKKAYYAKLDVVCQEMDKDGGIGLLINNVGTANEIPKALEEFSEEEIEGEASCLSIVSVVKVH